MPQQGGTLHPPESIRARRYRLYQGSTSTDRRPPVSGCCLFAAEEDAGEDFEYYAAEDDESKQACSATKPH